MFKTGALTQYIDVAQLVLYAFWIFFAGLIIYLRKEDKREGYPLESDRTERAGRVPVIGYPSLPTPKTFLLNHGEGTVSVPNNKVDRRPVQARPIEGHPGAALEPTGNPMLAGVGPGSWAERDDVADLTFEGLPKIVPMHVAPEFYVPSGGPNPIGMRVIGADGREGGVVTEIWIDRSEPQVRYYELAVTGTDRRVLLPVVFAKINGLVRHIYVHAILGSQFVDVPGLRDPEKVTRLEEERISAYYGAGTLYATASRSEPLL